MDNAIPFEKQYKPMTEQVKATMTANIKTIKDSERLTVKLLDDTMPVIVGAVIGGDNIVVINDMLRALKGERRKVAEHFFRAFVPHELRNNGLFGKKLAAPKAKAKERAFRKWEEKGEKYSEWGTKNVKVERKATDYSKKLARDVHDAIKKGGFTADQVLAIVQTALTEEGGEAKPVAVAA